MRPQDTLTSPRATTAESHGPQHPWAVAPGMLGGEHPRGRERPGTDRTFEVQSQRDGGAAGEATWSDAAAGACSLTHTGGAPRDVAGEGADFARALSEAPPGVARLGADANVDAAAELVGSWVTEAAAVPSAGQGVLELEFSVDSLRLGPLQGRVSISGGRADVELQASRPATASALRARQLQLQHLVRRESGGDVELRLL
ncbi:hypothetical protein SAMN05216359_102504 [Roseateles sp. YR242]|nr:hypothetical protein SAMN05216359_102504 [Roseateles sp. YR242]